MKNFFIFCATLLFTYGAFAQAPEKISYQAVVRNASNNLVSNQAVGMKISILQGSATGTVVYAETQTPTSNANGLVSIEIGGGTAVSGTMAAINWASGLYFVKTEIDPTGSTTYTITGTSQLLSVPYALYAKTSGSSTPGPQGATGATGPVGAQGQIGPAGTNGTNGIGYGGTSSSAKTISLGSKTFAVPQGLAYIAGQRIRFVDQTNAANFLEGTITSYSTTSMVVNIDNNGGSGTIANWNLTVGSNLGTNGQGVPTGGATGQVLAKVDGTNYNTAWVTPSAGGGGATLDLLVTKTTNAQVLTLANSSANGNAGNPGDLVTFNNVVTPATLGTYNTATSEYTVGVSGIYLIQAVTRGQDATTPSSSVGQFLFVDVDGVGMGSANTIIDNWDPIVGSNLATGSRSRGFTSVTLPLTVGQKVRILGLSNNSSTASGALKTDQSCKFMIVKL